MLTLLWKDQRINRLVLVTGAILLLGPPLAGWIITTYSAWRWGPVEGAAASNWMVSGQVSLLLSLITFGILGGNAVASERADRSAEFLAYLPPSRRMIITSKAILAGGVAAIIFITALGILYGAVALAGELQSHQTAERSEFVRGFGPVIVLVFGSSWLASCRMMSPVIATCTGYAAPWSVLAILTIFKYALGFENLNLSAWNGGLCIVFGILSFVAGVAYFLHRVEP